MDKRQVFEVNLQNVKTHALGKGKRSKRDKEAMVKAAIAAGWAPGGDDEADALWILDYAMACL